jgi:hypothetical protein
LGIEGLGFDGIEVPVEDLVTPNLFLTALISEIACLIAGLSGAPGLFGFGGTDAAPLKGSGVEGFLGLNVPGFAFITPLNGSAGAGVLDLNGSGIPCFTVLCCLTERLTLGLDSSAFRPPDLEPENPFLASISDFVF